tara:strand:- start:11549 stop:12277 length:729 start_codon:yes stop_codon:yes gene_type:complete
MAINVNTVYQTVLYILNKEQRGYMTPMEFNSIGTQVQLEIFEKYFDDLNQQLRVPQADTDYADRVENIDEKIAIFKTFGNANYVTSLGTGSYFILPTTDIYGVNVSFYRLGSVVFNSDTLVQRLDRTDFYRAEKSQLTKPTTSLPAYLYENNKLFIKPTTIKDNIQVDYVRKPNDINWGFTVGTLGQYIYQENTSVQFDLHESEQTEVILNILIYAGIIIRDPQVVQAAVQQVQADEVNSKS